MSKVFDAVAPLAVAEIVLDNKSGTYSPEDGSVVLPLQPLRIRTDDGSDVRTMFVGVIFSIDSPPFQKTVTLRVVGKHKILYEYLVSIPPQNLVEGGSVVDDIFLATPDVGSGVVQDEVGNVILTWVGDTWGGGIKAIDAIRQVTEAEHGKFFMDRSGIYQWYNNSHLLDSNSDQVIFNDTHYGKSGNLLSQAGLGTMDKDNYTASGSVLTNPTSEILRVTSDGTAVCFGDQVILTDKETYRVIGEARSDGNLFPRIAWFSVWWTGTLDTNWQDIYVEFVTDRARLGFGATGASAGEFTEFRNMRVERIKPDGVENIKNLVYQYGDEVRSFINITSLPREQQAAGTVIWDSKNAMRIAQGAARDVTVRFRDDLEKKCGAITLITPIVTTDYTAHTNKDGSGVDVSALVTMSIVNSDFSSCILRISHTYPATIYIDAGAEMRGTPIYGGIPQSVSVRNQVADLAFGARYLYLNLVALDDLQVAIDLATWIGILRISAPGLVTSIELNSIQNETVMLALTLFDRIQIVIDKIGHNQDYFIIGEEHVVTPRGYDVQWLLEPALSGYWIMDTSKLDDDTKLGGP